VITHHREAVNGNGKDIGQLHDPVFNLTPPMLEVLSRCSIPTAQEHLLHAAHGAVEVAELAGLGICRAGGFAIGRLP